MGVGSQKLQSREVFLLIQDLNQFESYIRAFWEFLPIPVCYVNPAFNVLDLSKSFEDLSGFQRLKIVGEGLERVFARKKDFSWAKRELFERGNIFNKEILFVTKEKRSLPVSLSAMPRQDEEGNNIGYFFAFLDISQRKQLEEHLREKIKDEKQARALAMEEKDKTLAIITNLVDGLLVFDQSNKLALMNPRAESFFQIKGKEVVGKKRSDLLKIQSFKALMDLLKKRKRVLRKEFILRQDLILEVSALPIIRKAQQTGTLVILHDITREKMVEKMKTDFVSLAAHQLRTPLSAIKWTLGSLLNGDFGSLIAKQRRFLKKAYLLNERMIALVNDLLDVSRIEKGRYIYKMKLIRLEKIVEQVVHFYQASAKKKGLILNLVEPKDPLPWVKTDAGKIKLVLQNLLENAIKYTAPGGHIVVSLSKEKRSREVQCTVKDTGIGIPLEEQKQVFSKFFRASNAVRLHPKGSGLGLFIAKNIIEKHQGRIWFDSQENKGTTFSFTLPIALRKKG